MISVRDISKRYGRLRAVQGVSFELERGQVVGLLGPNGAGKSTTIRMIAGSLPPDRGEVLINGRSALRDPLAARAALGYLPEAAPMYPEMHAEGYLDFRGRLWGMSRRERRAASTRTMEQCGVSTVSRRRIGALSKGFRRRVGLAATLLHDPPVLVLDEPTDGLDPSQVRELRTLIRELGRERTMLICSHQLAEVERTCDRVIVMASGMVRADGSPDHLASEIAGPARYLTEMRANPSASPELIPRTLAGLAGVASAQLTEDQPTDARAGWVRVRVQAEPDAGDLRESLAGAAGDAGFFLRELIRERTSLEALFVRLTEAGTTEAGPLTDDSGRDS